MTWLCWFPNHVYLFSLMDTLGESSFLHNVLGLFWASWGGMSMIWWFPEVILFDRFFMLFYSSSGTPIYNVQVWYPTVLSSASCGPTAPSAAQCPALPQGHSGGWVSGIPVNVNSLNDYYRKLFGSKRKTFIFPTRSKSKMTTASQTVYHMRAPLASSVHLVSGQHKSV